VETLTSIAPLLRERVAGRVVTPDDADYDATRAIVPGGIDIRPAAIVRVRDAADVASVVAFARETGTEIAVRSGGHSGAGHGSTDGGVVIDLRELKDLDINPGTRTAWAGTGLTAGEVTRAAAEHGLAIGFGDTPSVGIGGITLGGGIGYLVRRHGLTIDNLVAAEMVIAAGDTLEVDAEHHPDLFWAIRGGGGNFGVATRFRYRLHPLDRVVGGMLVLPATSETIAGYMELSDAAPDELSSIANVMPCPPMPFVPPQHHGSLAIVALVCWSGETDAGVRALAPLRALAHPIADMVKPIPYPEMYAPEDADYHPTVVARTLFTDRIAPADAATVVAALAASDAPMRVAQLRVLGGAAGRVPGDATAYAHRSRRIMINVAAFYSGPADRPRKLAWVEGLAAALRQGDDAAYVNFLADDGAQRVRAAYPHGAYERLAEIKAHYDPTNLFHRNHNVPPAR
jgi:hypothetical protein